MELRIKRRVEYAKVLPFSRCVLPDYWHFSVMIKWRSSPPRSLSRLSPISRDSFFHFLLSLASSAVSQLSLFFLVTSDLNRHFGATFASPRIEDRASTHPLCSQGASRKCVFNFLPPFVVLAQSFVPSRGFPRLEVIHAFAMGPVGFRYIYIYGSSIAEECFA